MQVQSIEETYGIPNAQTTVALNKKGVYAVQVWAEYKTTQHLLTQKSATRQLRQPHLQSLIRS